MDFRISESQDLRISGFGIATANVLDKSSNPKILKS
jgi:hypothetical protein